MKIERGGLSDFLQNVHLEAALATENGPKHVRNEDRFVFFAPGNKYAEKCGSGYLFGVMDGCGGTPGGADASQLCADSFRYLLRDAAGVPGSEWKSLMEERLREANRNITKVQEADRNLENMACAATIAWIREESDLLRAHIVHVGDTRAYLIRGKEVRCLTSDHKTDGVLQCVLGMSPEIFQFDSFEVEMADGDILLIASDGLWKPFEINLAELVHSAREQPDVIVANWLTITRRNGSDDDQTAVAIKVE